MAESKPPREHDTKNKLLVPSVEPSDPPDQSHSSPTRGRKRRRHSAISASPERSPSPSRGHGRRSASRHREKRRWRHHRTTSSERSDFSDVSRHGRSSPDRRRRRSDAEPDHTFRGRARNRSRSRTEDAIQETSSEELDEGQANGIDRPQAAVKALARKRSPPPSRGSRSPKEKSQDHRRQRSLPNQYHGIHAAGSDADQGG